MRQHTPMGANDEATPVAIGGDLQGKGRLQCQRAQQSLHRERVHRVPRRRDDFDGDDVAIPCASEQGGRFPFRVWGVQERLDRFACLACGIRESEGRRGWSRRRPSQRLPAAEVGARGRFLRCVFTVAGRTTVQWHLHHVSSRHARL